MSEKVNCQNEADVLSCLRRVPQNDIIIHEFDIQEDVGTCWMAVFDQPFLIGEPEELLSSGQFNKVDVIIGTNVDEGIFSFFDKIANPALWEDYKNNFDIIGPTMLFVKMISLIWMSKELMNSLNFMLEELRILMWNTNRE